MAERNGRESSDSDASTMSSDHNTSRVKASSTQPKLYQIDLSLPPQDRYTAICTDFKEEIKGLVGVYNRLLRSTPIPRLLGWLAKVLLRKVYSKEETEEIKGISKVTDMPIHLIIAYNTFLDLFSGCMSGGVKLSDPSKMIHFRNLDWGMEPLRKMIIRVEYVLNGSTVARAVTYAGYIGVLTGVREGLSVSLNYRARIKFKSWIVSNILHYLMVLLGSRRSMSSHLRKILLSPGPPPTLDALSANFQRKTTSPCYLTFCSPDAVLVIEKDLHSAVVKTSDDFLAVTNHDVDLESLTTESSGHTYGAPTYLRAFVWDSIRRKRCMCDLWNGQGSTRTGAATTVRDVKKWLRTYPIRNDLTHFCCIMDPSEEGGGLLWVEACEVAVDTDSE